MRLMTFVLPDPDKRYSARNCESARWDATREVRVSTVDGDIDLDLAQGEEGDLTWEFDPAEAEKVALALLAAVQEIKTAETQEER